ncbi:MAG: ImmA/IrrE family metallo-endopeptidase [bacterium]|nr:ImmA/IrrE family metallo-endopeptidase [bacterium]
MRHRDIVSLVQGVLRGCEMPFAPRNPRTAARRLGVQVVDWHFPDRISSLLVRPTIHGAVIYLNCRHQLTRQNWHLAHELGHYILHPVGVYASTLGPGRLEREANIAATEILMPEEAIRVAVARKGFEVPALARMFGVSREALRLRLGELRSRSDLEGGSSHGVSRIPRSDRICGGSSRAVQGQRQETEDPQP